LTDLCGDARRVHLIRNAVVLSEFPMRDQKAPSEPPTILAVGRLDQKKGFHILLSACSELNREGVPFHCVIVGDGDEWESLHELKKLLGINEKVQMVGNRDFSELQLWYEQATLLVVPSVVAADGSTDGLPTVVIEAFARGAPVIGSSTAGIPEVIRHGVNGFVVPAGVSSELASRIKELLSNEDLCRLFATQARFTAELDFDLDRNVQALARLMIGEVLERTVISRSMAISSPSLEHKHTT